MLKRIIVIGSVLLALASSPGWSGDMALTRNADLYRLGWTEDGLQLIVSRADGEDMVDLIPQTAGIVASALQVGVDEATGTVVAVWQQGEDDPATVQLAALVDGTWYGPLTLAGSPAQPALHPELLLHRAVSSYEEDDGTITRVATTFAHLAWWSVGGDDGAAVYGALPLAADGMPLVEEFQPFELRDLVPWGIGCHGVDDTSQLVHPKLFVDPETGDPHAMATDFGKCLVQIVQLRAVLDTDVEIGKRGRHVVLFGRTAVIGINPEIDMAKADIDVGHDLSVVLYWNVEDGIQYATMRESGWSDVNTLAVGDRLTRQRAVDLIRALAR